MLSAHPCPIRRFYSIVICPIRKFYHIVICSFLRFYRIVVESKSALSRRRRRRRAAPSPLGLPCGLTHAELLDRHRATQGGARCYVAAELPRVDEGTTFVVGDNRTYGGYYNGPLDRARLYAVWFGFIVTVDGVSNLGASFSA